MLLTGQRCVPAALKALGFTFAHPDLDKALADVIPALKTA
jgi:NAD dependent epimerase/dehydratase family enzyme